MSVRRCTSICAALIAMTPVPALAAASGSKLVYSREGNATRCPDEDALREAVHARLGYDAFSPWGERAVIAEILEEGGKLRARLRLLDEHGVVVGTREVRAASDDCEELVRSLALSISITLDPLAPAPQASSAAPDPAVEAAAASPAEHPAAPPDAEVEAPLRVEPSTDTLTPVSVPRALVNSPQTELSLRAGPVVHAGFGPGTAQFGGRLGVTLDRGVTRLVVDVAATLPASVESALGGRANVQVTTGSLAPCLRYRIIAGCGLVVAGRVSSWATGTPNTRSDSAVHFALGARVEARTELTRSFQLIFGVDGLRNLTPVSVTLHEQELWQSPGWAGSAAMAVAFRFR
ncbi:MAG: hypothetical protein QM756_35470 [Polyangiaceae bacterium]